MRRVCPVAPSAESSHSPQAFHSGPLPGAAEPVRSSPHLASGPPRPREVDVRWFAQEDADGAPPSLRWTAGIGLVGAGVTVAAVLAGPSSAPAPRGADAMPGA